MDSLESSYIYQKQTASSYARQIPISNDACPSSIVSSHTIIKISEDMYIRM